MNTLLSKKLKENQYCRETSFRLMSFQVNAKQYTALCWLLFTYFVKQLKKKTKQNKTNQQNPAHIAMQSSEVEGYFLLVHSYIMYSLDTLKRSYLSRKFWYFSYNFPQYQGTFFLMPLYALFYVLWFA